MQATLRLARPATYADYLAVEEHSEHRHELIDGVIVAMAGVSDEHNAIAGRLAMLLGVRLRGECRYFSGDQRFWIAASSRSRYADGSIVCGRPDHPAHGSQVSSAAPTAASSRAIVASSSSANSRRLLMASRP